MLRAKLQADQLAALKSGNRELLEVLRFVVARIKARKIDTKQELTDEQVVEMIKKHVRELDEAISAAGQANRQDLVDKNQKEKALIIPYLPAQMSDEQLSLAIDEMLAKHADIAQNNPKALLGMCVRELKSSADSSRVVQILNTKLSS